MAKGKGNKSRGRQQNNHKSKKDGGKERQTKKRDEESNDEESEDEVDYAAGADAFASDYSGDEGEEENGDISSDDDESEQGSGSNVEDSSDDDDDSEEEQEDVTAVFKGVVMQNDDSEGDSNEYEDDKSASSSEDESKARQVSKATKNNNVDKGAELCTFDLRNLVAMNSHQIASNSLVLSQKKKKSANSSSGNLTIPSNDHGNVVNEEFLLAKATEGCTQLVQALWQLPTEKSDAGPLVELPSYDEIRLPRSLVSMHIREYFLDSC